MQRLRSLRRSMSRSSRKSGGSPRSVSSSPRQSQDMPSPAAPTTASTSSTPDLRASKLSDEQPAVDPPSPSPAPAAETTRNQPDTSQLPRGAPNLAEPAGDALSQPQASQASLSTSITDSPVLVEHPSPSPPEIPTTATGRELPADSTTRRRKGPEPEEGAAAAEAEVEEEKLKPKVGGMPVQRPWLALAVASGGFAALNGAFAKLTTGSLTTTIATFLSTRFNVPLDLANPVIRGFFFLLNILSNIIMWALFTRALTAHSSATKVSLINTSANFLVTAVIGALIFSEVLPPSWFGGAALLVLGTLIIGRDRQGETDSSVPTSSDEEVGGAETFEKTKARRTNGLGIGRDQGDATELEPLLAGDETEGVKADGEDEA